MNLIKSEMTDKMKPFKQDFQNLKRKYSLRVESHFDAAHRLCNYDGKCKRIHGHTYKVFIDISAYSLLEWGAVMDFVDIKKIIKEHVEEKYDHKLLLQLCDELNQKLKKVLPSSWIVWMEGNTTAENIAYEIYQDLKCVLKGVRLENVTIYETPTNAATYEEKDREVFNEALKGGIISIKEAREQILKKSLKERIKEWFKNLLKKE